MFETQEIIRPSSDLRNHYSEVSKQCRENGTTQIITVNGRGDTVLLSYEEYCFLKAKMHLYEDLAEAEDDVRNGRVYDADEAFNALEKSIEKGDI